LEPSAEGVVFDGFPRTKAQAKYLLSHYNVKRVYFLDLSKEEAIQRISARRICPDCGQNYNLMTQKPVKEGVCDSCKGKLIVRPDDKPDSIEKRILEFYEQTYQLKEVFDENNLMVNIPADQDIDSIFTQLKADFSKIS
jgi:adenylate kinase